MRTPITLTRHKLHVLIEGSNWVARGEIHNMVEKGYLSFVYFVLDGQDTKFEEYKAVGDGGRGTN